MAHPIAIFERNVPPRRFTYATISDGEIATRRIIKILLILLPTLLRSKATFPQLLPANGGAIATCSGEFSPRRPTFSTVPYACIATHKNPPRTFAIVACHRAPC